MIRFEVDSIHRREGFLWIPGRLIDGRLRVGSAFTKAVLRDGASSDIHLIVYEIETYGHLTDELFPGLTAALSATASAPEAFEALKGRFEITGEA